jgi:hypothetical protein
MTYEVILSDLTGLEIIVKTNDDGSKTYIPKDERNSDYQRYLNPEAEQSTPNLPA